MLLSLAGREVTCRDEAAEEEGGGWEVAVDLEERIMEMDIRSWRDDGKKRRRERDKDEPAGGKGK